MDDVFERYGESLRSHVFRSLPSTLKSPQGLLRFPFVDPGSVYDGNLWDWDSFWATYALINLAANPPQGVSVVELHERIALHGRGNVLNFLDYQLEDGYIPMMVKHDDGPVPYLNRKHLEGVVMNMHKPFLCQQIRIVSEFTRDWSWIAPRFAQIESYLACYDRTYLNGNCGLYVWADDIMIGMDNDPATFGRPRFSTANIFLNAFMVSELEAAALIAERVGRGERAVELRARAAALTERIQAECWDPRDRFFYSVDVDVKTRTFDWFHVGLGVFWKTLPLKIRAWSGFVPMLAGFATAEQAQSLARVHARDASTFRAPFGITSLAQDEKMFNVEPTINPSNWLGPIWLIANYAVFRGMLRYGYRTEATELCSTIVTLLGRDLERTGTLHEFYNPFSGEPVMNGGFLNWNMLVLNMIDELGGARPVGFA